ncbi:winged helix-turn-helix domain-containing tetratricopeptide repeat protein [Roseibium album]|uniref:winged helix-turn-helix domain-containing tetratricopeptide repeat protein n=1 Tax=Roseibium album TaxID=311410 RepID=UPI00249026C0|nr:winged helix-turn-helix domain-containing protein [Roseibium album]
MIYCFGDFELDTTRQELRCGHEPVSIEPLALGLLQLLLENHDRLVTKQEINSVLWDDRAVSDAALTTCVRSARSAVGDSGAGQQMIKTIHGRGLRWIAPFDVRSEAAFSGDPAAPAQDMRVPPWQKASPRPSIAVLKFGAMGGEPIAQTLGEAIPHELIAAIARLRWISVIARGSSFRFGSDDLNPEDIRERLGIRYVLSGSVEVLGRQLMVNVVLTDTIDGQVIWADRMNAALDAVHEIREKIIAEVIFAIEVQIPLSEASKARLRSPDSIDAWTTYHLGLQSLYRFDEAANEVAVSMFKKAVAMEPGFARAHAALSFAHFKTAFMHYSTNRGFAVDAARRAAERAIEIDPMDPFANFSMGRSLWLIGDLDGAKGWLSRSTSLSPNFAQGLYARAWTETISGSSTDGLRLSDEARKLSPLDPLLYAMLGTRALSLSVDGHDQEAAEWGERAARAPGAHDLIRVIALFLNELAGNHTQASDWARMVRADRESMTQDLFFRSFPFSSSDVRKRISGALKTHGIP